MQRYWFFIANLLRDWYSIAEQPVPAPHLAHPEECAALHIVLVTMLRVSRSCELFTDGFDLYLLQGAAREETEAPPIPECWKGS